MPFKMLPRLARLTTTDQVFGTGWLPPVVDRRDYSPNHPEIRAIHAVASRRLQQGGTQPPAAPPAKVDLTRFCSPIENQGQLGSCTAHAAVGIVEYFERRSFGKHLDGSRLFVYKTTRNLLGLTGDTGAWLKNAMAALIICGVPNENYWEYTDRSPDFDREPPPFVYSVADDFTAVKYFGHDPVSQNIPPGQVLDSVKSYLALGVPSMFGFSGYPSFERGNKAGYIPVPTPQELAGDPDWGHAIAAVGYDDALEITNLDSGETTTGALLIRNSWSRAWGQDGYGWMSYDYVRKGVAMDFWSLLSMRWIDTDRFFD